MIRERLELGSDDLVVELASNDGYLLQHFVGTGIPILGIDPAANVAEDAEARGVPTLVDVLRTRDRRSASSTTEGEPVSIVGNNVLAQVPDLNDFVAGVRILLRDDGTATFEFPHLLHLLDRLEYDTIYHEHFSYFSLGDIRRDPSRPRARRLRRRGALDARRLASRVRPARGRPARARRPRVGQLLAARGGRRASLDRSATRGSPRRSRSRSGRSSTS